MSASPCTRVPAHATAAPSRSWRRVGIGLFAAWVLPAAAQEHEGSASQARPAAAAASAAADRASAVTLPTIVPGSCQFLDPERPAQLADLRWVRLSYEVSAAGELGRVEWLSSSNDPFVDARVMRSLRSCRIVPASQAGMPVAGRGVLAAQVSMRLQDPPPGLKPTIVFEKSCNPEYPAVARRAEATGRVRLRFHFNADSRIEHVELTKSSGHDILDMAALQALVRCPRRAGTDEQGRWTGGSAQVEYEFKLE